VLGRRYCPADRLKEPPSGWAGIDIGAVAAFLKLRRDTPGWSLAGEIEKGLDHGLFAQLEASVKKALEDLVVGYLELADGRGLRRRRRRSPSAAIRATTTPTATAATPPTGSPIRSAARSVPTAARPRSAAYRRRSAGRCVGVGSSTACATGSTAATAAPAPPPPASGTAGRAATTGGAVRRSGLVLAQTSCQLSRQARSDGRSQETAKRAKGGAKEVWSAAGVARKATGELPHK
jgi:hypothetical protein